MAATSARSDTRILVPVPRAMDTAFVAVSNNAAAESPGSLRSTAGQPAAVHEHRERVADLTVLAVHAGAARVEQLRALVDRLRERGQGDVVVVGGADERKAFFVGWCSERARQKGLHAGELLNAVAKTAGGGGGGRADWAQAGGRSPEKVPEAVAAVPAVVRERLARSDSESRRAGS